jgi:ABC-type sugar transport system substrate-binding protein
MAPSVPLPLRCTAAAATLAATTSMAAAAKKKKWTGPDGDNPKPFVLRYQKYIGPFMAM